MSTEQDEFYQNLDVDNITPEQAAQMLEMGWQGDTGTPESETGGEAPAASTESDGGETDDQAKNDEQQHEQDKGEAEDKGQQESGSQQEPVLLAKDGKHTIPYEKLTEAREGEKHWKQLAEAQAEELDRFKAEAEQRANAGEEATQTDKNAAMAQDAIDKGVDPDLFGDFTEEDLAKGVAKLVQLELEARDRKTHEQQQEQDQQTAAQAHYDAIYKAHPDADSIIESKELDDWLKAQPTHVRKGCEVVLQQGSTQEVIELFDTFKENTGATQSQGKDAKGAEQSGDAKAKAREAIEGTTTEPPSSLSDIPGGSAGALSPEEQMASLEGGTDLLERMQNMSPEKIEAFLNKQL